MENIGSFSLILAFVLTVYTIIASILGIALVPVLSNTTSGVASLFTSVQGNFDTIWGSG